MKTKFTFNDLIDSCYEAINHVEQYNGNGRAREAKEMIEKAALKFLKEMEKAMKPVGKQRARRNKRKTK